MKNFSHLGFQAIKKYAFFLIILLITLIIWITGTNETLFFAINARHTLLPVSVWMAINDLASPIYGILPLMLLVLTLCFRREKWFNIVLLIISYYVVFELLKLTIHAARPHMSYDLHTFFWIPLTDNSITKFIANQSFPSGHTGNAAIFVFALIRLFAQHKIWLRLLLLAFLVIVMITRICTGWHFPLDVLGSVLISFILTELCWRVPALSTVISKFK
jgi:undecaprenyl-diphosphatase